MALPLDDSVRLRERRQDEGGYPHRHDDSTTVGNRKSTDQLPWRWSDEGDETVLDSRPVPVSTKISSKMGLSAPSATPERVGEAAARAAAASAQLSEEADGVLRDFAAISQVQTDLDESEANEVDFMEVMEYVRMATLMLFRECQSADPKQDTPPAALH